MGNKESRPIDVRSPHHEELSNLFEDLADTSENGPIVKQDKFKSFFSCAEDEKLSEQLLLYILNNLQVCDNNYKPHLGRKDFIQGLEGILQTGNTYLARNKLYFSIMTVGKESASFEDLIRIFYVALCLSRSVTTVAYQETELENDGDSIPKLLATSLTTERTDMISCAQFCNWSTSNCQRLMDGVHAWIIKKALHRGKSPPRPIKCCPVIPRLFLSFEPNKSLLKTWGTLWLLATVLPQSFLHRTKSSPVANTSGDAVDDEQKKLPQKSEWNLLYDSYEHGQSLNRFKHHCFSYRGPSVMLLQLDAGITLAVCADVEWKEASSNWGKADCRLLQIRPTFKILKSGDNMMFFNERSRGLPSGIILGQTSCPTVSLDTDFSSAKLFYKKPSQHEFSVNKVEVWGCGGLEVKEKQKQQQQWERRQAEKLQKVKLPGQWDENPDKALLDMAGITTSHAQR